MPKDIMKLMRHFMREPAKILLKNEDIILKGIKQYSISIEKEDWKMDVLLHLFGKLDIN
jgi:superfamily II DNA/RNA helicase